MRTIPYGRQSIDQNDIEAVVETLKADFLTQGPKVLEFEEKFAKYVHSKYAVAVSNGTAALHLAAMVLNVKKGTRVLCTPITFAASANCIKYCGGTVEFVDIDPATALMDINQLKLKLESKPDGYYSGIIPVDFAGLPVKLDQFRALADKYNLWIIEDACHAPGGSFVDDTGTNQFCGNGGFADIAIFSFHPVKHIACGEGGMITTNKKELYDKLLFLRTHGITKDPVLMNENHGGWYYEMVDLGYNYRMTDIQCALGITQLAKADKGLNRRRELAKIYYEAFKDSAVNVLSLDKSQQHAYHLFVILIENRKELYDHLRSKSIYAQVHYIPVHMLPYYKEQSEADNKLPMAEAYYEKCLSLPMYPTLTEAEQQFVIDQVLTMAK